MLTGMALGPKTRRFLAAKKGAGFAVLEELAQYDKVAASIIEKVVQEALASASADLNMKLMEVRQQFADIRTEFAHRAEQIMQSLPELQARLERALRSELDARTNEIRGPQGDVGPAPSNEKLLSLITPLIRLPTEMQLVALIRPLIPQVKDGATPTKDELTALISPIARRLAQELAIDPVSHAAAIARAIEALPMAEKLDYEKGLKNKPGIPVEGPRHTLHRGGGGKEVFNYDLSSLCDGNTKIFTVPANTRILSVAGTDAPSGTYRPLTDWTGSGSTTLTLTAQVAAPGLGATLYILYVAS
jgi:hypothetical protein